MIRAIFQAGATGARFTFSYGTPQLQVERARQVRTIASELGIAPFLVADLAGEKCRFAEVPGFQTFSVSRDDRVKLTSGQADPTGTPLKLPVQIPRYLDELSCDDFIVVGDGDLLLRVIEIQPDGVLCVVLGSGTIRIGRGILLQKRDFRPQPLTSKDLTDFQAIMASGVFDAVAVSFVGSAADVQRIRELESISGVELPIVAKIETQLGVENLDSIAEASDALMAARGDLALTMPWEDLPRSVERLSQAAARQKRPWILATQLAEGLERFEFPTRAEICDLAHWISRGAYGAMLSFETAWGRRPVEAVRSVRLLVDRFRTTRPSAAEHIES